MNRRRFRIDLISILLLPMGFIFIVRSKACSQLLYTTAVGLACLLMWTLIGPICFALCCCPTSLRGAMESSEERGISEKTLKLLAHFVLEMVDGKFTAVGKEMCIDIERNDCACSVCLEDYSKGNECIALPCKHFFHKDCILHWVASHKTCPLCIIDIENGPLENV